VPLFLPAQDRLSYTNPSPLSENPPYNDEFGWSPGRYDSDPYRLGGMPLRDDRPPAHQPPEHFYGKLDHEHAHRHKVEHQETTGIVETKQGFGYPSPVRGAHRFADDPRAKPPGEPRVTSLLSPHSYIFTRPYGQDTIKVGERSFNGHHFSMADHRRNYSDHLDGMAPTMRRRNTYRLNPAPWDAYLVDYPPPNDRFIRMETEPTTVPHGSPAGSYRLD
jgi:hypothetical protein